MRRKASEFCIIHHDEAVLQYIVAHDISVAVQWEVARFALLFNKHGFSAERIGELLEDLKGPNVTARRFHRVVLGMLSGDSPGPEVSAFLAEVRTQSAFAMEGGPDDVFRFLDWEDDSPIEECLGVNEAPSHVYGGQGKFRMISRFSYS